MRQSQLFTKTRKEAPSDETSKNAQLLIRAGFINKEMSGVYDFLPLGLRVINKIEGIIREEMNNIGGQEISMSSLQRKELWEKTDRWDSNKVDNWFKTVLSKKAEVDSGREEEIGLAFTHEEPITQMMEQFLPSYKDLPVYVYQFQTKFRNELRAKSGLMRGREFLMKDLYSFSKNESEFREFYEKCASAYMKIFNRVGLGDRTFRTIAGGGAFTSGLTDEFQTISEVGEDVIYIDKEKNIAINKEVYSDDNISKFGLDKKSLEEHKAIEVGNIFPLDTIYSKSLLLETTDKDGEKFNPVMGSYGIGLGRLMGTVVEVLSDEKGIVWPEEISPFRVHLVRLGDDARVVSYADNLYSELEKLGVEVLYDDRDLRPGEKFADSDLIGIPTRLVVSEKTVGEDKVEVKKRTETESKLISLDEVLSTLQ